MSEERLERLLLLAQTGELTDSQRKELDTILAQTESARAYRDDMEAMLSAVRETPLPRDLDPMVMRRIEIQGRREVNTTKPRSHASFLHLWRPALASGIAAIALLFLGIRFAQQNQGSAESAGTTGTSQVVETMELAWDVEFDDEVEDLNDLLALAEGGLEVPQDAGGDSEDELLQELLNLEGISI
jgi:anti-sigma-K factor RskA